MSSPLGTPIRLGPHGIVGMQRVDLADRAINEAVLEDAVHRHPQLLPISAIGDAWGPLVSLGTQIPTAVGPIDNLLVSPRGDLTIVEAKLWRNPEARRAVVGQILDYAAALPKLAYHELDALVRARNAGRSMWDIVSNAGVAPLGVTEASFVDGVSRSLSTGGFLLLVVGDGIREDLSGIGDLLDRHPGLAFHLALVELALFRDPDAPTDELLIVPSVVGQSREVTRAIVDVRRDKEGEVHVAVIPDDSDVGPNPVRSLQNLDEFEDRATHQVGAARAATLRRIVEWWRDEVGEPIELKRSSVTLRRRAGTTSSGSVALTSIGIDGRFMISVARLVNARVLAHETADDHLRSAGYTGSLDWPYRWYSLDDPAEVESARAVLRWLADQPERT